MNDFDVRPALENTLNRVIEFLPQLLAALVILVVGYFISSLIAKLVRKGLQKLRFDRALHNSPAGNVVSRIVESPARLVSRVAFWLLFFGFISMAVAALDIEMLNDLLASIYSYVPHIIAAVAIFLVASAVSAGTPRFIQSVMGRTATAKTLSAVVPVVVMSLAIFMILNQLGIARDIVNILFTAIVGSAALAMALAFGLGGRDAARELLNQAVDTAKANSGKIKADARRSANNAKRTKDSL